MDIHCCISKAMKNLTLKTSVYLARAFASSTQCLSSSVTITMSAGMHLETINHTGLLLMHRYLLLLLREKISLDTSPSVVCAKYPAMLSLFTHRLSIFLTAPLIGCLCGLDFLSPCTLELVHKEADTTSLPLALASKTSVLLLSSNVTALVALATTLLTHFPSGSLTSKKLHSFNVQLHLLSVAIIDRGFPDATFVCESLISPRKVFSFFLHSLHHLLDYCCLVKCTSHPTTQLSPRLLPSPLRIVALSLSFLANRES